MHPAGRHSLAGQELPVDPRSLLQGDYMRLRYAIERDLRESEFPDRGYLVFRLDSHRVARPLRTQESRTPLYEGESLVRFRAYDRNALRGSRLRLGAESYFFEEGTGQRYEAARYGGLRIDDRGRSLLVGLYDEQYRPIN